MSNQRNDIVHDYDSIQEKLSKGATDTLSARDLEKHLIDDLEQAWSRTQKTKDMYLYSKDSHAVKGVSKFAADNAQNLKFSGEGLTITPTEVVKMLKRYMGNPEEIAEDEEPTEAMFNMNNWLALGTLFYQHSPRPVGIDFLNGPLETERRRVGPRTRTVDDTRNQQSTSAAAVNASEVTEANTANIVRELYSVYAVKPEEDKQHGVNFFRFFVDPDSFGQSVENLFYTSFLVKTHKVRLYQEEGQPMVRVISPEEQHDLAVEDGSAISSHHIASFDYATWRRVIEQYGITESYLGHRDQEEATAPE
ncbi:hypothetical protein DICA0_E21902 [Diutina catenulata]